MMKGEKDLAEAAVLRLRPVKVEMKDAPTSDEPKEDDDAEAYDSVVSDLMDALKSGDKEAVKDSLKAAMMMCMSDHDDEEDGEY